MAAFTWTDLSWGQPGDPSPINAMGKAVQDFANPARVVLRQTIAQSLGNGAFTGLKWDVEDFDNAVWHDAATDTRSTVPYDGWYQISGTVGFSANASGIRAAQWRVNGSDLTSGQTKVQTITTVGVAVLLPARTLDVVLTTGQYVELFAFQDSGGALNTSVVAVEQSNMQIRLLSRL